MKSKSHVYFSVRGGVWNERVEVAVSNGTKKEWNAQSVVVNVPALKDARRESWTLLVEPVKTATAR